MGKWKYEQRVCGLQCQGNDSRRLALSLCKLVNCADGFSYGTIMARERAHWLTVKTKQSTGTKAFVKLALTTVFTSNKEMERSLSEGLSTNQYGLN